MARRLFPLVAAVLLLALGQRCEAQDPPKLPPPNAEFPKAAPPVKEFSKQEVDALVEKAFGKDSAEMKQPIRMWLPDIGAAIAAASVEVVRDNGSVRFTTVSVGFTLEAKVFRGEQMTLIVDQPITDTNNMANRRVTSIEITEKATTIRLTPGDQNVGSASSKFQPLSLPKVESDGLVEEKILSRKRLATVTSTGLEMRFKFKIDPEAPLADLLPTPPKTSANLPLWTDEDLAKVPELTFGEPISKELSKQNAMEKTAHIMAKINHLNAKKRDGFMLAMLEQRPDLRGLPLLMGDDCRTREEQARAFAIYAELFAFFRSPEFRKEVETPKAGFDSPDVIHFQLRGQAHIGGLPSEKAHRATVAAAMQVFMPEPANSRAGLAKFLASVPHLDASKALATLAIFSPEDEVRAAAIEALKLRRERDYTDVLLQGFRYPLPAVSKRAADAIVKLERKDLLANLIDVLESPDPRLPVTEKRDGKDVTFVRELVKVNHHRNCLLCHAPGNTDNTPEGVLKVAVPLPSEPLPKPSEGGGYQSTPPPTPDIVVRLDMTYLRQDFSVMMPVSDAHPWPEMQRFDFLVRTRTLTAAEAQAYEDCCEVPEPGRLSPYHRSALYALRELTGRDTEPTAAAWRNMLKLTK